MLALDGEKSGAIQLNNYFQPRQQISNKIIMLDNMDCHKKNYTKYSNVI